MKKIAFPFIFMLTVCSSLFAQKTVDPEKVCEPEKKEFDFSVKPVDEFKDELTIDLTVEKAYDNYKNYNKKITYTETFTNETAIIQIAPNIGLQISVARVETGGKKYYLSSWTYYLKKGKCWEPMSENPSWSKMRLNSSTTGNSYNGVGFEGDLKIY